VPAAPTTCLDQHACKRNTTIWRRVVHGSLRARMRTAYWHDMTYAATWTTCSHSRGYGGVFSTTADQSPGQHLVPACSVVDCSSAEAECSHITFLTSSSAWSTPCHGLPVHVVLAASQHDAACRRLFPGLMTADLQFDLHHHGWGAVSAASK
jgi:hypothetical protein